MFPTLKQRGADLAGIEDLLGLRQEAARPPNLRSRCNSLVDLCPLQCTQNVDPLQSKKLRKALGFRQGDHKRICDPHEALVGRRLQKAARPQRAPGVMALHGVDLQGAGER